jgi:hypothetical protein
VWKNKETMGWWQSTDPHCQDDELQSLKEKYEIEAPE